MSIYHSDKCTKEELDSFKKDVLLWLEKHFDVSELKIKAFPCYNGDFRIYFGHVEYENKKSSFRREEANKNEKGEIVGYKGTRGHHTTKMADYISINRDEFETIKKCFETKDGNQYDFFKDYIFDKLHEETLRIGKEISDLHKEALRNRGVL